MTSILICVDPAGTIKDAKPVRKKPASELTESQGRIEMKVVEVGGLHK